MDFALYQKNADIDAPGIIQKGLPPHLETGMKRTVHICRGKKEFKQAKYKT
jgi:hypothetical protein